MEVEVVNTTPIKTSNRTVTLDKNGEFHSVNDEPAVIQNNGTKHWCKHGKRHRENGPASIYKRGLQRWFIDGLLHREDGPAIEDSDGWTEWWFEGNQYLFEDYIKKANWTDEQIIEWKLQHNC